MSTGGNRGDETRRFAVASVLLAIGFSMLFMGAGGGGGGADTNTTASCSVGFFATNVTESVGNLVLVCNQVGWSQLTGFPSGCSAGQFVVSVGATLSCAAPPVESASTAQCSVTGQHLYNITESSSGVLTSLCSYPDWTKLVNFPSGCSAHLFVTQVGVTLSCTRPAWTDLTGYPAPCAANQFVIQVDASLICSAVAWSGLTGFPSGCPSGQYVTVIGTTLTCGTSILDSFSTSATALSTSSPTIVQKKGCSNASTTSLACAFDNNVAANDVIIYLAGDGTGSSIANTPTDTLGTAFTLENVGTNTARVVFGYSAPLSSSGADTVTITSSVAHVLGMAIYEISGNDFSYIYTSTWQGVVANTATTTWTGTSGKSYTNTPLALAIFAKTAGATITAGTGFTVFGTGNTQIDSEYSTGLTASSSTSCAATMGSSVTGEGGCFFILARTSAVSIALSASTTYYVHVTGRLTTVSGGNGQIGFIVPGGSTIQQACGTLIPVAGNNCTTVNGNSEINTVSSISSSSIDAWILVQIGSNAGTIYFSQGYSSAITNQVITTAAGMTMIATVVT